MSTTPLQYTSLAAWQNLWRELKLSGDPVPWHSRLVTAYQDASRHYHNLKHIEECLQELDAVQALANNPTQLRLALWFHDAVYDSGSTRNEEDSADLAAECLGTAGATAELITGVRDLVMCTKLHRPGRHPDGALIIDIDLAILGQESGRFDAYERGIRAEYDWVPVETFRTKRAEILRDFLARPSLYVTPAFQEKYDAPARANLARSILQLSDPLNFQLS